MDYSFFCPVPGRDELAVGFGMFGNGTVIDHIEMLRVDGHRLLGFLHIKGFRGRERLRKRRYPARAKATKKCRITAI